MWNIEFDRDIYWRIVMFFCAVAAMVALSDSAFASTFATGDVIGDTLCRVTKNMQGNIAKAIATIAIFVVGISLFMGKVNWGTAAMVAAGVGIIFGAGKMVAWIGGTNAGQC